MCLKIIQIKLDDDLRPKHCLYDYNRGTGGQNWGGKLKIKNSMD